jgi:hypothetical protein
VCARAPVCVDASVGVCTACLMARHGVKGSAGVKSGVGVHKHTALAPTTSMPELLREPVLSLQFCAATLACRQDDSLAHGHWFGLQQGQSCQAPVNGTTQARHHESDDGHAQVDRRVVLEAPLALSPQIGCGCATCPEQHNAFSTYADHGVSRPLLNSPKHLSSKL